MKWENDGKNQRLDTYAVYWDEGCKEASFFCTTNVPSVREHYFSTFSSHSTLEIFKCQNLNAIIPV